VRAMAAIGMALGRTEPGGFDPSPTRPIGLALWASSAKSWAMAQLVICL
jgi:hypothetical protein